MDTLTTAARARRTKAPRLKTENLGPIKAADVHFGDLTVIVGPQSTGKSIFLQTLKLLIDRDHIHDSFKHHNMTFSGKAEAFLEAYYGKGMSGIWSDKSKLFWKGKDTDLLDLTRSSKSKSRYQQVFYIPAQRVMSLPSGASQNFGTFNFGDPYTLRAFSDSVHDLIQNEFEASGELFPAPNRLNDVLRRPLSEHLFGGNKLIIDDQDFTKRLALNVSGQKKPLGFLSWSAGQREFTPMLMGLYWLCTVKPRRMSGATQDETIEWVVIEEPEMGLHPQAISAVLLLVLELLRRDYRVVVSTHSPVVLEMVWAIQQFKKLKIDDSAVRALFSLPTNPQTKSLTAAALKKSYKVYYFDRHNAAQDISDLDPYSADAKESDWGGIVEFSSRTNSVIADAVNKKDLRPKRSKSKAQNAR